MPTLTYEYVYFAAGGSHTRQPRVINSYGGFTPIPSLNSAGSATLQTGTSFQISPAALPASELIAGVTYHFSFVNVSGLTQGGLNSFDHNVAPPAGTVGTSPVKVLVVYLPEGGPGGNGGSGAVIDAFDETAGSLVNDTFVTVSTNGSPNAGQTASGNIDGFVDTTYNAATITALSHIVPTNANFHQWVNLGSPVALPPGHNLVVAEGDTIYALAFYRNPAPKTWFKDIKDVKEHVKEHKELLFDKHQILDGPSKQFGKEKDGKEIVENPGDPVYQGDPAFFAGEINRLSQAIAKVEATLEATIRGQAFIRQADRPEVGKSIAQSEQETD